MRNKCLCIKNYGEKVFPERTLTIFKEGKIYEYTDQQFITREYPEGYNVEFFNGEFIYFRKYQDPLADTGYGMFNTYFKTFNEIRKEKLIKINKL